jgi:hypothetical protein
MSSSAKKKSAAKKTTGKKLSRKNAAAKKTVKKKSAKKKAKKKTVSRKKVVSVGKASAKLAEKNGTKTEAATPGALLADVTPEARWNMIAVAAYHKAEQRGFTPGDELRDWVEAEKEISELVNTP